MDAMSISVELERVQAEATQRGPGAFLLTVTDDGRPHVVAVTVGWDEGALVMSAGRTSVRNAGSRPGVSLLWPPAEPGGYSLIVDGQATASPRADGNGGGVSLQVTRAVLHRPAAGAGAAPGAAAGAGVDADAACGSDCVPLLRT
jgi:hypothetical protein